MHSTLPAAFLSFMLLLLLHSAPKASRAEVIPDNIALPQEQSHRFVLPAPGLRQRPHTRHKSQDKQFHAHEFSSNDLDQALLPQGRGEGVARLVGLDVACNPDYMTVTLDFDNAFTGIVYAKGHHSQPECMYVGGGVGARQVEFQVDAGRCGTQLVEPPGDSPYLEGVLVIQNKPGIQEVWDSARGVRCVFEGGLRGAHNMGSRRVSAALNVDLLDQKMVTFAAHTAASANLDVQVGRGPFARSASGMVRLGQLMTMVVGVEGPDDTDVFVRRCVATDGKGKASYTLTDTDGCVPPSGPQVLGPWQKTRETGGTLTPVLAYSHFQAFNFPDENDVFLECEVDLCIESCPVCPNTQAVRRRRSTAGRDKEDDEEEGGGGRWSNSVDSSEGRNSSVAASGLKLGRKLRVVSPEDFSIVKDTPITLLSKDSSSMVGQLCLSSVSFAAVVAAVVVACVAASCLTGLLCARVRFLPSTASTFPPDSSFHAFSTVSGKTG